MLSTPPRTVRPTARESPSAGRRWWVGIGFAVVLAAAGWLPFLHRSPTSDEGGFLLVASQWRPGSSLYGAYWVDRPPLLIALFQLADRLGGTTPLRLLGAAAAVLSTLLAAWLALIVHRPEARARAGGPASPGSRAGWVVVAPSLVAAVFLSTPLFGAPEVDGEVLAVPAVLLGVAATVYAGTRPDRRSRAIWSVVAGIAGACAVMIKQNVVDVGVFVVVLALSLVVRGQPAKAARLCGFVAVGATATLGTLVGWAAHRGTSPTGLWQALVPFRAQAAAALDAYSHGRAERLHGLLVAGAVSGAAVLVLALLMHVAVGRCRTQQPGTPDLLVPVLSVLAWEIAAMALGGSYWHHYLTGMVPGLVLLTIAGGQRRSRLWPVVVVTICLAVVSDVVSLSRNGTGPGSADVPISDYLSDHAAPGDTVVVCFGHADIVWGSGLTSPYPYLWSLPVQVKDPRLERLDAVLRQRGAPSWVVVRGALDGWGVEATATESTLQHRYRPVDQIGTTTIYRLRSAQR